MAVSQWESGGTANVKLDTFLKLCKALATTPEHLVYGHSAQRKDDDWPFPFDRSKIQDLDPNDLELVRLFMRSLVEHRAKRRHRKS